MPRLVALIPKEKHLLRFAFRLISQIGIHYRNSSISRSASFGSFPRSAPRPGDRLPFVVFHEADQLANIQNKVKGPAFHLLLFSGNETEETIDTIRTIFDKYENVIQIRPIPLTQATKDLYRVLGMKNGGYYLVRPDMYVAYRSNRLSQEHAKKFLRMTIHLKDRN